MGGGGGGVRGMEVGGRVLNPPITTNIFDRKKRKRNGKNL